MIPAGTYTLFTVPGAGDWKLVVSKQTGQWGTEYHEEQDLGRADLKVEKLPKPAEQVTISIVEASGSPTLNIDWGTDARHRALHGALIVDGACRAAPHDASGLGWPQVWSVGRGRPCGAGVPSALAHLGERHPTPRALPAWVPQAGKRVAGARARCASAEAILAPLQASARAATRHRSSN